MKTNGKPVGFWLVSKDAKYIESNSHISVFVNLKPSDVRPEFFVVPSPNVTPAIKKEMFGKGWWYSVYKRDIVDYLEAWGCFGQPS